MNSLIERRRAMMVQGGGLPYDAEVEYIETDGYAYIDTLIKGASTVNVDLNIYIPEQSIGFWVFGSRVSGNDGQFAFFNDKPTNVKQWRFGRNSALIINSLTQGIYNFKNTKNVLEIGNITMTAADNNFTSSVNILLLTLNVNGTPAIANIAQGARILPSKMYQNGNLVRDYIPVRKNGVGYLFDKVSEELFGNPGTGDFVLGPDVQ